MEEFLIDKQLLFKIGQYISETKRSAEGKEECIQSVD